MYQVIPPAEDVALILITLPLAIVPSLSEEVDVLFLIISEEAVITPFDASPCVICEELLDELYSSSFSFT